VSDRAIMLFGALVLLSVVVLGAVLYAFPQRGLEGGWQVPQQWQMPERRDVPPSESRRTPADRWRLPFGHGERTPDLLWIRPFGLHQRGIEGIGWYATSFGVLLISSFSLFFLFPQRLRVVSDSLRQEPRRSLLFLLLGLIGYALMVLLVILLFLNFTTAVLLLLVTPALLLATLMGLVSVELCVGQAITRWGRVEKSSVLMELIVGVIVLFLVSSIPYAGWVVVVVVAALGFGALLYTRFGSDEEWSFERLET